MTATPAAGSVVWVQIGTADVAIVQSFYGSLFGWTYPPLEAPGGRMDCLIIAPDAPIPVGHIEPTADRSEFIALGTVSYDVPEHTARLTELGAEVLVEPTKAADGGDYTLLRDPRGNVFNIWTPPAPPADSPPLDPSAFIPRPGTAGWFEIGTREIDTTKAFYAKGLGWDFQPGTDAGDPYWYVIIDGRPAGGVRDLGDTPHTADYSVHSFLTTDLPATFAKAVTLGASIEQDPITTTEGLRHARLRDPRGNRFGLFTPPKD
ncbi:VOC family protein [Nocardia brasiliensis]